jgi:hypothetical protein
MYVQMNDAVGKSKECGGRIENSVVLQPPIDWIRSIKINSIEAHRSPFTARRE